MLLDEVQIQAEAATPTLASRPGRRVPRSVLVPALTRLEPPIASAAPIRRLLVVGTGALAHSVVAAVRADRTRRYEFVGACGEAEGDGLPAGTFPILGPVDRLPHLLETHAIDTAVVAIDEGKVPLPVRGLMRARLRGTRFERSTEFYERLTGKIAIETMTPRDVLFASGFPHRCLAGSLARVTSALVAGLALLAASPLLALIAVAIVLDSPGPVFFVQERVGLQGRSFRLIKFRTMRVDREAPSEWVRDNGHRITRVGYWLRRFRLDELPQLINIVRGEMNLVGPRPHPAANYPLLATVMRNVPETGVEIPLYSLRTLVRPGITGWAQVKYGYANGVVEEVEKLRYDLYYLKHRSMWLDLRILLETFSVVFFSRTFETSASSDEDEQVTYGPSNSSRSSLRSSR